MKPEGDAMVGAAQMAIKDEAPQGRIRGRRIVLAIEDSSGPSWGMVSDAVIRLVLKDEVIAMITSSSGADAHLSEQVGNRVGVPVLTLSADATTTQADIPWIFRLGATDVAQAQLIVNQMDKSGAMQKTLLISQNGHDGDRGAAAMLQALQSRGGSVPSKLSLDAADPDLTSALRRVAAESPQAIVLWTNAAVGLQLLTGLRSAGVRAPCYLSKDASSEILSIESRVNTSGETWMVTEDIALPMKHRTFSEQFQEVHGTLPTSVATRTYDAVTLLVDAMQVAGPNRARVRDQLSQTVRFNGSSGEITLDREGNDQVSLHLVKLP
jgi:branched-chain amino acid transport system substrate-binding protein